MSDLTLAESLLLLTLDDERGKDTTWSSADPGLAGALLIDLVRHGHLAEDGKRLVATPDVPGHPVLRAAYEAIAADDKARKPDHWVGQLPRKLKPFRETLAEPLVAAGVLEEERRKTLGVFESVRFPEADPEPERRLRAGLQEVLLQGREPTDDEALLLSLLEPLDLVKVVVDRDDRREAKRRAKEVAERTATSKAVKSSIDGTTVAIMAATSGAMIASTSSGGSN